MDTQALTWRKRLWTSDVAAGLKRACGDAHAAIGREVLDGHAEAWEIEGCGFVVTRLEPDGPHGRPELVIVAGEGRGGSKVIPALQAIARKHGATVRVHSDRAGMGRYLAQFGFTVRETVYGWKI